MNPAELPRAALSETLKAAPPLTAFALTMNEWVALMTGVYVLIQAAYLLRKWWREERAVRAGGGS